MDYHNPNKINIKDIGSLIEKKRLEKETEKQRHDELVLELKREVLEFYLKQVTKENIENIIAEAIAEGKNDAVIISEDWWDAHVHKCLKGSRRTNLKTKYVDRIKLINTPINKIIVDSNDSESIYQKITNIIPDNYRVYPRYICLKESSYKRGFQIEIRQPMVCGCVII